MLQKFGKNPIEHVTDEIQIKLVVWEDPSDNELKYVYTPGGTVNFVTNKPAQHLEFLLVGLPSRNNNFEIHSYSIQHRNMRSKVEYWDGSNYQDQGTSHVFPNNVKQVKFGLQLVDKGTYITLNVIDRRNGAIIACDPQVENGTKT